MSFLLNRRVVSFISALAFVGALTAYVRTNGVAVVPEGSVAVVTRLDGSHSDRLLEPGVRLVTPVWESIRIVSLSEQTVTTDILKAQTLEGLPVSVILEVTYKREAKANELASSFASGQETSGLLAQALLSGFTSYAKGTTSLSFVPVPAVTRGTEGDITAALSGALELKRLGVTVTQVKVVKQWLAPELQVPVDAGLTIKKGIEDLSGEAKRKACETNPNC